ncbi:MAG: hypothetical protein ACLFSQ_05075 [Candidatus Zixiibacteriota bacterium]
MKQRQTLNFLATIFIITGLLLVMENLGVISGISIHWPIFLFILGTGFSLLFFTKQRNDHAMIWLASFILLLGGFFYYLNFTNWKLLANLWPIFLGIVGFSFLMTGIFSPRRLYLIFAVFFIGLFLIFSSVFAISAKLWPISLVVFGVALIILQYLLGRVSQKEINDER